MQREHWPITLHTLSEIWEIGWRRFYFRNSFERRRPCGLSFLSLTFVRGKASIWRTNLAQSTVHPSTASLLPELRG